MKEKGRHNGCSVQNEYSVSQGNDLASLGKPRDAESYHICQPSEISKSEITLESPT